MAESATSNIVEVTRWADLNKNQLEELSGRKRKSIRTFGGQKSGLNQF